MPGEFRVVVRGYRVHPFLVWQQPHHRLCQPRGIFPAPEFLHQQESSLALGYGDYRPFAVLAYYRVYLPIAHARTLFHNSRAVVYRNPALYATLASDGPLAVFEPMAQVGVQFPAVLLVFPYETVDERVADHLPPLPACKPGYLLG